MTAGRTNHTKFAAPARPEPRCSERRQDDCAECKRRKEDDAMRRTHGQLDWPVSEERARHFDRL